MKSLTKSLTRYTVTCKENGESYSSTSENDCKYWAARYTDHVSNQDNPWKPTFIMTTETID